ncbi:glutathione S-transferase [Exophiala aquamarina CBS 119918]|uniref:Glutathione S-transferase n=1 Tax=Exophiala aquamarina CBS 119918 TaxID=1182545 RepID=A0A072PJB3_9EURO|nr:glutathione S-transferase [Exophiala aquamarina CBS 119918]KEF55620.1 glutathione S-transferase [Exophiala aquamarina CBS 119918]
MAGVYSAYGINRYVNEAKRLFDVLESRLNTHDWLAGDKYTISDIASYAWLRSAFLLLDIDVGQWPGLDKWMKRIGERPAVLKGVNVPRSSRTSEEMAQQFKSMRDKVDAMKNTDKCDS